MRGLLLFTAFVLIIFSSCDEEECFGCNLNPKVIVDFQAVASLELADSLYKEVKDSIKLFVDSLSGELSQSQIQVIKDKLETLRIDSTSFAKEYNLLKSGKVRIDEISVPGAYGFEQFQDTTLLVLALPVNMQSDSSTFIFTYHGLTDTLQLNYNREIVRNLDGFRMRIHDIVVSEEVSTFDSLQMQCNSRNCSNDQTTIFIYF